MNALCLTQKEADDEANDEEGKRETREETGRSGLTGAGDAIRTRDPLLGKQVLYR